MDKKQNSSGGLSSVDLDSEITHVRNEIDSDLLQFVTVADHDSDLNNLSGDFGTFG